MWYYVCNVCAYVMLEWLVPFNIQLETRKKKQKNRQMNSYELSFCLYLFWLWNKIYKKIFFSYHQWEINFDNYLPLFLSIDINLSRPLYFSLLRSIIHKYQFIHIYLIMLRRTWQPKVNVPFITYEVKPLKHISQTMKVRTA